jgi:hypothetical protein
VRQDVLARRLAPLLYNIILGSACCHRPSASGMTGVVLTCRSWRVTRVAGRKRDGFVLKSMTWDSTGELSRCRRVPMLPSPPRFLSCLPSSRRTHSPRGSRDHPEPRRPRFRLRTTTAGLQRHMRLAFRGRYPIEHDRLAPARLWSPTYDSPRRCRPRESHASRESSVEDCSDESLDDLRAIHHGCSETGSAGWLISAKTSLMLRQSRAD